MTFVADKLRRAREAACVGSHAADLRSAATLLGCYATLLRSATDPTEVAARLRIDGRVFPFRLRKCDIFTLGEVLYERQYHLRTPLPARPVVIDAGANIGTAAVFLLARYPGAVVHCFEPQSDNFRLLTTNLGGRDDVVLNRAAVGAAAGEVALYLAAHGAEHSTVGGPAGSPPEVVPAVRLADYLAARGIDHVDLLKLDVEGSELDALRGLGDRLRAVRVIAGEVHERFVDRGEFYAFLARAGFAPVASPGPGHARPDGGVHQFEAVRVTP